MTRVAVLCGLILAGPVIGRSDLPPTEQVTPIEVLLTHD